MKPVTKTNQAIRTNGANLIIYRNRFRPQAETDERNSLYSPSDAYEVLLTKDLRGKWVLPGGEVEYDLDHDTEHPEPYLDAAIRETSEEIGLHFNPQKFDIDMEAVAQQRVFPNVPELADGKKVMVIGTVCVYSILHNVDTSTLILQPNEVTDAKWWVLHAAIESDELSIGYRRMLAIFANNHQCFGWRRRRPTEFNLGSEIEHPLDSGVFI